MFTKMQQKVPIREEPLYKLLQELMFKTYSLDLVPDKQKFCEKLKEIRSDKIYRITDKLTFGTEKLDGSDRYLIQFVDLVKHFRFDITSIKGMRVLDIGPSIGGSSLIFSALGAKEVVAIESVPAYTDRINFFASAFNLNLKGINTRFENYETLEKFDFINCYGVFYFIKNQEQAIQKMYRTLNKGGFLHIETKTNNEQGNVPSQQLTKWLSNTKFKIKNYDSFDRAYFLCKK